MSRHPHEPLIPRSFRPLVLALLITTSVMMLEILVGLLSHSLALLADAGHMATDAAALGMSLLAAWIASQPATRTKTYGFYRTEILAAFFNGLTLWLVVAWIVYQAIQRFLHPPVVQAPMMLVTAVIGLIANLGCSWILRPSQAQSLNQRSAYLHVLADAVGSVSVIGAALAIWLTGWNMADPIASILICLIILWGSWNLISQSVNILLEGAPAHLDAVRVMRTMQEIPGVRRVHDIHLWTITSGMEALSAHVVIADVGQSRAILRQLHHTLEQQFGIQHATLQLEDEDFERSKG